MLRLISETDQTDRSEDYLKGFAEALKRVEGLTKPGRTPEEVKGLLVVLRQGLRLLEDYADKQKRQQLSIVDKED